MDICAENINSEKKNKYKVSLITLCYNQLENATKPFLESLYKYTDTDLFELILVNNASIDGTKDYLEKFRENHSNVKVINNDENYGYAKGNNQGLKIAKGEYIFFLNNDLLFTLDWLNKFVTIMENNKDIGMISCKTNYCGEDIQLVENASEITISNYLEKTSSMKGNDFKYVNVSRVVFFCIGISRAAFEKVGYLDENYGRCWFEDDDYTLRIQYEGFKIAIAQDIFIYHNHSQSTSKISKTKEGKALFAKNKAYFEEKHKLYMNLKQQAIQNTGNEYEKMKKKHIKYKKLFAIFLFATILEFIILLIGLLFLLWGV